MSIGRKMMEAGANGAAAGTGREDAHGKLPQPALRIEKRTPDGYATSTSFLYGEMRGGPLWHPDLGIQFVIGGYYAEAWDEWRESVWKVTVHGEGLRDLWQHIAQSRLEFIAVGERVTDVTVEEVVELE